MTTYTITRALSRINALKDKLAKSRTNEYVATINSIKIESADGMDLQKKLLANAQANRDIVNEILKIKLAVEQSNLTTQVVINGKNYSVREAIELKYLYQTYLKDIASIMQNQLHKAKDKQNKANQEIEKAQEETIKTLSNAGVELTQTQIDERVKSSIETVRLTKELTILSFDPSQTADKSVEFYEQMVTSFLEEVDYVLSESNAVTTINFD
ncbi:MULTISPECIES: hypothetical protein [unclassified Moraxella]|uniref:hypothetical protein n=1 Tax=unclassified Moraxella TaxID=2685852 RepID=UPI003AF8F6E0